MNKIKVARRPYESFPLSSSSRSLLCVGKRTIKILHFIVDLARARRIPGVNSANSSANLGTFFGDIPIFMKK